MTRINCVPAAELSDAHLGAEYRELPRIVGLVNTAVTRGERPDDPRNPTRYVLGPGHVRFFYPRLGWVRRRYAEVVSECRRRGRAVNYPELPELVPAARDWVGEWEPDTEALALNRQRIQERSA